MTPICIIVMGVSASGKTTQGKFLSSNLQCTFIDGDDLHPQANVDKMHNGIPLNDEDRKPWLAKIATTANDFIAKNETIIIACSALKKKYRDFLREKIDKIHFIFLNGSYETILKQMEGRKGHFMPESLLKSQFETLELPDTTESDVTEIEIGKQEAKDLKAFCESLQ